METTTPRTAAPDLITPWRAYKGSLSKRTPRYTNRASDLGGDCERQLVYWRVNWREAAEPPLDLQIIFQEGEKHEREVLIELQRAGVQVIEQQLTLEMREYQVSGHVDATIVSDGESIPIDVKTMASHTWDAVFRAGSRVYQWSEVEAGFARKSWLRKYLAQISLYCLMRESETGLLLCLNKGTGALAQVVVELDYDYAESLLRRAERINDHVASGSLPDRIPFDEDVCPKCPFFELCLPDRVGVEPIAFLEDATVEGLLEERAEFEEGARAFKKADDRLKAWAKARPEERMTVGRWLVRKKPFARGVRVNVEPIGEKELSTADS